jgi:glycosyltransferase involved in cell wall biosynthesis
LDLELVFFRRGSEHDRFAALQVPMHHVETRRRMPLDWRQRAFALRALLASDPPRILHTWLFEAHEVGLVAALGWPRTRVVLAHRSGHGVPGTARHLLALRPFRRRIDHVVANSPSGAEMMLRFGVDASRISVIANGLPPERVAVSRDRADVRRELGIPLGVPLLVAVSRPDPNKDFPTLFAGFREVRSRLPSAELLLCGPTERDIDELAGSLPSGARAIGLHQRPADLMNAADVIVVASRTEGHSNVADEALMLGMPVVTTDTGGHPPLVRSAGGRVVPVGRADLLSEALLGLLESPPRREDVRAAAERRLSMSSVADATIDLYERLLDHDGSAPG